MKNEQLDGVGCNDIERSCGSCKFFDARPNLDAGKSLGGLFGICRKYPPRVSDALMALLGLYMSRGTGDMVDKVPDWCSWWESTLQQQDDPYNSVWPVVYGIDNDPKGNGPDWCGEWELRIR